MHDASRREILHAMGLKTLQPRFVLANAKPSPVIVAVEEQAGSTKDPSGIDGLQTSQLDQVQAVAGHLAGHLDSPVQPLSEPQSQAQQTPVAIDSLTAELEKNLGASVANNKSLNVDDELSALNDIKQQLDEAAKPLRFRLRLVRVGELLMVLNQPALEWQEEKNAQKFFSDIYYAIKREQSANVWQSVQFDWPPSKNLPFAEDMDMARQTCCSFIQEQMREIHQVSAKHIIVWGKPLTDYILTEKIDVGEIAFMEDIPVLCVDELEHYWTEPENKRLLQQYLQSVKLEVTAETASAETSINS